MCRWVASARNGFLPWGPKALPEGEVLLICHSGMRSRMAMSILGRDGSRSYVNVGGGIAQQLEVIEGSIAAFHKYVAKKSEGDRKARAILRNATVGGISLNHRQRSLLANSLRDPDRAYTVACHQAAHSITYPTALNDLNNLVAAALLQRRYE